MTTAGSAEPQKYTSAIYGYTVVYPGGWFAARALRQLDNGESPLLSDLATDRFTRTPATDLAPLIFIGAQPVPDGFSLERWGEFTVKVAYPDIGCKPARQENQRVGGEPAILYIYECGGGFVLWSALVHGKFGYDIVLANLPGDDEATDRTVFDPLLAALTFTN